MSEDNTIPRTAIPVEDNEEEVRINLIANTLKATIYSNRATSSNINVTAPPETSSSVMPGKDSLLSDVQTQTSSISEKSLGLDLEEDLNMNRSVKKEPNVWLQSSPSEFLAEIQVDSHQRTTKKSENVNDLAQHKQKQQRSHVQKRASDQENISPMNKSTSFTDYIVLD